MTENNDRNAAPYASFRAFSNFIDSLRESVIPGRIDPSVFGKKSGGTIYSLLATLKSLNLIDDDGGPQDSLRELVNCPEVDRKKVLREIIKNGYPSFWDGSLNLEITTPAQFDEHVRSHFNARGSTVDKVAAFFLAAAEETDIPISIHLKNRKPTAPSSTSRKSQKARKQEAAPQTPTSPPNTGPISQSKPLEYLLIDLLDPNGMNEDEQQAVWKLINYLARKKQNLNKENAADDNTSTA